MRLMPALLVALAATPLAAKDLIVTIAKPQNLYVFDAKARTLVKDCDLGVNANPGVIQFSKDSRIAYALVNRWQDVIGIDLATCERVFYAAQSGGDIVRRSIASLAVSQDGSEVYTVRNPVRHHVDRYEVMEPEFAVYKTDAGLQAEPDRTFPAPRRSTIMAAGADGSVYLAGHDLYRVDPAKGEIATAIPNRTWDRPTYSPPDILAFWPTGAQNDRFMLLYTAAVFTDASQTEMKDFVWGQETVNLKTGETEIDDFASFEVLMFSGIRNPVKPTELFGVYTQLSKHDLATDTLIKRVDLPHTYYGINIASDGSEIYIGGTNDDIGVYDPETLERIGEMRIPSGGDMGVSTLQLISVD